MRTKFTSAPCPKCKGRLKYTHTVPSAYTVQEWVYTEDDRYPIDVTRSFPFDYFKCEDCKSKFYWGDTSWYDGFIEE